MLTNNNIQEIIQNSNDDFSILSLPTGSGKSTTVPQEFIYAGYTLMCLQLTRPAVMGLESYMKTKLGNENVGFAADSIVKYTNTMLNKLYQGKPVPETVEITPLVYCTYGHFKIRILGIIKNAILKGNYEDDFKFCDIVMIDEAHNENEISQMVIYLMRYGKQLGLNLPNCILASATINPLETIFPAAKFFKLESRTYPITIEYLNEKIDLFSTNIYDLTVEKILEFHSANKKNVKSPAIVFCSGKSDVDRICDSINDLKMSDIYAIPAYSELEREELEKITNHFEKGRRKVIVATNIIETSLTIDGANLVVCLGTEKAVYSTPDGNTRLVEQKISKSSARQRAGRVGRTCPGHVIRMYTEKDFNNFAEKRLGDLYRNPIHLIIIELINSFINPVNFFEDSILHERVVDTISVLQKLKFIEYNKNFNKSPNKVTKMGNFVDEVKLPYKVTEMGNFVAELGINIRYAACIYKLLQYENYPRFQIVVIFCILNYMEGGSYLNYPKFKGSFQDKLFQKMMYYDTHFKKFETPEFKSTLGPLINIFNSILYECVSPELKIHYPILKKVCREQKLHYKKVLECLKGIERMINLKDDYQKGRINMDEFEPVDMDFVEKCLPEVIEDVYSDQIYINNGYGYSKDGPTFTSTAPFETPHYQKIYVTSVSESQNKGRISRFINFYFGSDELVDDIEYDDNINNNTGENDDEDDF